MPTRDEACFRALLTQSASDTHVSLGDRTYRSQTRTHVVCSALLQPSNEHGTHTKCSTAWLEPGIWPADVHEYQEKWACYQGHHPEHWYTIQPNQDLHTVLPEHSGGDISLEMQIVAAPADWCVPVTAHRVLAPAFKLEVSNSWTPENMLDELSNLTLADFTWAMPDPLPIIKFE